MPLSGIVNLTIFENPAVAVIFICTIYFQMWSRTWAGRRLLLVMLLKQMHYRLCRDSVSPWNVISPGWVAVHQAMEVLRGVHIPRSIVFIQVQDSSTDIYLRVFIKVNNLVRPEAGVTVFTFSQYVDKIFKIVTAFVVQIILDVWWDIGVNISVLDQLLTRKARFSSMTVSGSQWKAMNRSV